MKKAIPITTLTAVVILPLALAGCSSKAGSAGLGAVGGVAAGGGTYEYRMHREMERVEEDYKAGRIDKKEYEARKDEINRMSIIK